MAGGKRSRESQGSWLIATWRKEVSLAKTQSLIQDIIKETLTSVKSRNLGDLWGFVLIPTIEWKNDQIRMIDQRKLPCKVEWFVCRSYQDVIRAIQTMVIRGAPAIGVAAAMGLAMGASTIRTRSYEDLPCALRRDGGKDGQGAPYSGESAMGRGEDVRSRREDGRSSPG